jgi:hypothetical protein
VVANNLKLFGVVLVEEGDRNAHDAVVVAGDRVGERYFDRIVVVVPVVGHLPLDLFVLAELQVVRHGHEGQFLVAAPMVQVGEPDRWHVDELDAINYLFHTPAYSRRRTADMAQNAVTPAIVCYP